MGTFETRSTNTKPRWTIIAAVVGAILVLCVCICLVAIAVNAWLWGGYRSKGLGEQSGTPRTGEQIFSQTGCSACHSLTPSVVLVGPSLSGIAERAARANPDMTAEMYLTESILEPNAYVVAGYQSNIMPGNYENILTDSELNALLDFLLSKE
jgi:cytochrome c551/c552